MATISEQMRALQRRLDDIQGIIERQRTNPAFGAQDALDQIQDVFDGE